MNAVVIGGSKGVGLAISNQFAGVYENICIVSRSKESLKKASASIGEVKSKIFSYQGDIAEKDFGSKLANHLNSIKFGNVAEVNSWGKYDGAVSIEVAEHLLPEQADNFCKNLANTHLCT